MFILTTPHLTLTKISAYTYIHISIYFTISTALNLFRSYFACNHEPLLCFFFILVYLFIVDTYYFIPFSKVDLFELSTFIHVIQLNLNFDLRILNP